MGFIERDVVAQHHAEEALAAEAAEAAELLFLTSRTRWPP